MTNSNPPKALLIIGIIGLLWNLMGCVAFFSDATMSAEAIAELPQAQQELRAAFPSWLQIFYGMAVTAGFIGCIGLIMKKKWTTPAFLVSMIAVFVQQGYSLFFTDSIEVLGSGMLIFSILIILIAIILWWYARNATLKGWLR